MHDKKIENAHQPLVFVTSSGKMKSLFILTLFTLCMFRCGRAQSCNHEFPCKFQGGEPYSKCVCTDFHRDANSRTAWGTLVVEVWEIRMEWLRLKRRMYNSRLCGPTIRVKPGDHLTITLVNRLEPNKEEGTHNEFRLPNSTNLHLHGLHIGSEHPGDNVFERIEPGEQHKYEYNINKAQPAGTYWYHAHLHGSTYFQVMSGMSGMLIVEDDSDEMAQELAGASCPGNCDNDIELLLQPTMQYADHSPRFANLQVQNGDDESLRLSAGLKVWLENPNNGVDIFTVNGKIKPILTMNVFQMKRFRIVNAGGFNTLELGIVVKGGTIPACNVKEIAFDGVYLDAVRSQYNSQTYLTVGARVDWLVYCNIVGEYELKSYIDPDNEYSIGNSRRYDGTLMTIKVIGSTITTTTFPSSLPNRPAFIRDLLNRPVDGKFIVELTPDFVLNRERFTFMDDPRHKMEVGSIQEWSFINTMLNVPHPIHIHINHFQVVSYDEYSGPFSLTTNTGNEFVFYTQSGSLCKYQHDGFNSELGERIQVNPANGDLKYLGHDVRWKNNINALGYAHRGDWRDVLNVPPMSNITVRFLADEYTGTVVIHCHILIHEDKGMMMVSKIVDKGVDTDDVRSGSITSCPGFCMSNSSEVYPAGCKTGTATAGDATKMKHTSSEKLFFVFLFSHMLITLSE